MPDDLLIWERIKKGDKAALKELHDKYFHQLLIYAWRSTKNTNSLEELVSDCFIRLWEYRDRIIISRSVKNYLYLMLHNRIMDWHRKKKIVFEVLDTFPEIVKEDDDNEFHSYVLLYKAMETLPESSHKILELAVFQQLSYDQIAEKLGISRNTVKTQIGRAYRHLRETLHPADFYLFILTRNKKK